MILPLFVYGTLMYPSLFLQLSDRCPEYEEAILADFCPRKLTGRPYPGLIPYPNYATKGLLLHGLYRSTMARLDAYEGEEYCLQEVEVLVGDRRVAAQTYVLAQAFYDLVQEEIWQPEKERL